jgi:hypothetical protein
VARAPRQLRHVGALHGFHRSTYQVFFCRRLVYQVKRRLNNRQRIEMKRTVEIITAS